MGGCWPRVNLPLHRILLTPGTTSRYQVTSFDGDTRPGMASMTTANWMNSGAHEFSGGFRIIDQPDTR